MTSLSRTRPRRRTYHHGDLRAALLRAAQELLDEGGPDAVTIREAARRAGVSHAAPANHFADRRALLTALAAELFERLSRQIGDALAGAAAEPARRVRAFADAVIDFGLSRPNRYRLLWRRDLLDNDDARLNRAMDAIYDRLTAELGSAGRRRPPDRDTCAIALWSMVHGYVSMRIGGTFVAKGDAVSGEPRERAIVSLFLRALGDAD